jgi:transposase
MEDEALIRRRFEILGGLLDERLRRLVTAAEAQAIGYGGVSRVARATGVSRRAIAVGLKELAETIPAKGGGRIRRSGAGRKKTVDVDRTLKVDLERLVEPVTRGDPASPLRWTCKGVRKLAGELQGMGHRTSHRMVAELLHQLGYRLQANRKVLEGDRNAQFAHINRRVQEEMVEGNPVISVDTKKKEWIGTFKNGGREWRPKRDPERVHIYDFIGQGLGRVSPYGVYDLARNAGWVSVGVDHDTATFAVETIRRWWYSMGRSVYPQARRLLITADAGGSNGARLRLWKLELQRLADELGFPVSVCHFPPGTSKWNKIEHRLFSYISQNWRGRPLVSHEVIVNLVASTVTGNGLQVRCQLDQNHYPAGRKVTDKELASLHLERDAFHGEWNYSLLPLERSN